MLISRKQSKHNIETMASYDPQRKDWGETFTVATPGEKMHEGSLRFSIPVATRHIM